MRGCIWKGTEEVKVCSCKKNLLNYFHNQFNNINALDMTTKISPVSMLVKNFEDAGNMLAEFGKEFQEIRAGIPSSEFVVDNADKINETFRRVLTKTGHYADIIRPLMRRMRYHLDFAHDFIRYAYVKITDAVVEQQLQEIEAHYAQTASLVEQFNDVIGDIYEELAEQEKFLTKTNRSETACQIAMARLENILQLNEDHIQNTIVKLFAAMSTFIGLWQEKVGDRISDTKANDYRLASLPFEELNGSKLYKEPTVEEKRSKHRHNML